LDPLPIEVLPVDEVAPEKLLIGRLLPGELPVEPAPVAS
jgi:hypothetical protein